MNPQTGDPFDGGFPFDFPFGSMVSLARPRLGIVGKRERLMNMEDLKLTEFSVTLHAKEPGTHEFLNLHPHILAFSNVVPESWTWERGSQKLILTPTFCSITFDIGVSISGDGDSVSVVQTQDLETVGTEYPPSIAAKYIKALAPGDFFMAEMNWEIDFRLERPGAWLIRRFFHPDLVSQSWLDVETFPNVRFMESGSMISFSFQPASDARNLLNVSGGIADFASPTSEFLIRWLNNHRDHKDKVFKNLFTLLEVEDDSN